MEWIKLRSLRSTWLTLALAVCASAGIALATGGGNTTGGGMSVSNCWLSPWSGLGMLAGYAAITMLLGGLILTRRDA